MPIIKGMLKDQAGFTLTELMVAVGLLGGISLLTAKLMVDQSSQQNHIKTMASISGLMSRVESHLNNPSHCETMLKGQTVPSSLGTPNSVDATLLSVNGVVILKEGKLDFFSIPDNGVKLESSVFGDKVADLVVSFNPTKTSSFAAARGTITQRVSVVVEKDASTNKIMACGPVLGTSNTPAMKQICDTLSPLTTWDASTSSCKISSTFQCPSGKVVTKITNSGVECEDLQQQVELNEMFDFTGVDCSGKDPLKIKIIKTADNKFKASCD